MSVYSISSGSGVSPIHVPDNSAWKTARWTWAFWHKVPTGSVGNARGVFSTSLLGNATTAGLDFELFSSSLYFNMPGLQLLVFAAGDSIWHHVVVTFESGNVKLYVDGSIVNSASGQTMTWGTGRLVIAAFGNPHCRLSDMRIYSEALSGADVTALASGTNITANLVAHWPCTEGSGTTIADAVGGLDTATAAITWTLFEPDASGPYLQDPIVTPSRQWLRATAFHADHVIAIGAIGAVTDGATYAVNGTTRSLLHPFWSVGSPYVMWPLGESSLVGHVALDDADMAWESTGAWTEHVAADVPGGRFSAFGDQFRTSPDADATATWPFSGLTAHRHSVYISRDVVDTGRTTQAVFTAKDGTSTTLAAFTIDLSQQLTWHVPRDDNYGPELHRLGYVDLPDGQTSLTVTLSNGAGSGTLAADTVLLEPEFRPTVEDGDVVTVTLPSGTITVDGSPSVAVADVPVSLATDADFLGPILPPGERTLGCGANIEQVVGPYHVLITANRGWGSYWQGDVTVDDHLEMTANTGTAQRLLTYWPLADGNLTSRGGYTLVDGVQRFEFNVSGATFDSTARANVSIVDSNAWYIVGPATFTDLGGGRWRMGQSLTRHTWSPISDRTHQFDAWSHLVNWIAVTPGVVYTNWKWFDPTVPIVHTTPAHPSLIAQVTTGPGTSWMVAGRMMDALGTNASPAWRPGDFLTPADEGGGNGARILFETAVTSVRAVAFDDAGDPDHWQRFWSTDGTTTLQAGTTAQSAWFVAEVDDATGFPDGGGAGWIGTVPTFTSTFGGTFQPVGMVVAKIDDTHLIVAIYPTASAYGTGGTGSGPNKATVTAPQSIAGCTLRSYKVPSTLPLETLLDVWNDCGIPPWVNVPPWANDAMIAWMAGLTLARTPDGRKVYVEYGNENWNSFFFQHNYTGQKANEANFLHAQDPIAHPYEYSAIGGYGWQAHRAQDCRRIFRQAWSDAGRDPDLIQGLCGLQLGSFEATTGAAHVIQHEGAVFEAYVFADYQDYGPPNTDITGPDLAATFQRVDEDGMIDSLWVNTNSGRWAQWVAGHDSILVPALGFDPPYMAYEGGWSAVCPYPGRTDAQQGRIAQILMASSRMYRATAALQSLYQTECRIQVDCRYTLNYYSTPGSNFQWSDVSTAYQLPGTGDPAENPNPFDWPSTVSEPLGGRRAFATGVDFTSTPTPTPTAVSGSAGLVVAAAGTATRSRVVSGTAGLVVGAAGTAARSPASPTPTPAPALYLGRHQVGGALLLLALAGAGASGVRYRVYGGGRAVAAGVLAGPVDPADLVDLPPTSARGVATPGRYQVVYQYDEGGRPAAAVSTFEVARGGDPAGPVVAGIVLRAPEGDVALVQAASGRLLAARGPDLAEGTE